jgi:hypothetical protein
MHCGIIAGHQVNSEAASFISLQKPSGLNLRNFIFPTEFIFLSIDESPPSHFCLSRANVLLLLCNLAQASESRKRLHKAFFGA